MTWITSLTLPDALPQLQGRRLRIFRACWLAVLMVALLAQVAGAAFVVHHAFRSNPVFATVGLASTIGHTGDFTVEAAWSRGPTAKIPEESRLIAVDGRALPAQTSSWAAAQRIEAVPGRLVGLTIREPGGAVRYLVVPRVRAPGPTLLRNPIPLGVRMSVRLTFALITSLTLLGSAALLFFRRGRDPVAMLIASAFILIAATIDPPMLMWMTLGAGSLIDVLAAIWWTLLCIAFAAFPDGRFAPRGLRWVLLVAPACGVSLLLEPGNDTVLTLLATAVPIAILACQAIRYRKLTTGVERQQMTWAGFGFGLGVALLGGSLLLAQMSSGNLSPLDRALYYLATLCLFELAFAVMAIGLLVALLRFRLWDVKAVVSRSATLAIVTTAIGVVWAVSADVLKAVLSSIMGADHTVLSTVVGALLAMALFSPTKTIVLDWSKRRLNRPGMRLEMLPPRLKEWSRHDHPRDLALRALGVIVAGLRADGAAILAVSADGRELLAAYDIADPSGLSAMSLSTMRADARFCFVEQIEDEKGPVATLLVGPRSDGHKHGRDARAMLDDIMRPLGEAVRTARERHRADNSLHAMMGAVEARLARLEQRPAPI